MADNPLRRQMAPELRDNYLEPREVVDFARSARASAFFREHVASVTDGNSARASAKAIADELVRNGIRMDPPNALAETLFVDGIKYYLLEPLSVRKPDLIPDFERRQFQRDPGRGGFYVH